MRKVGVIGERDSVLGFKAVGFDVSGNFVRKPLKG